jgi:hypothetical protein
VLAQPRASFIAASTPTGSAIGSPPEIGTAEFRQGDRIERLVEHHATGVIPDERSLTAVDLDVGPSIGFLRDILEQFVGHEYAQGVSARADTFVAEVLVEVGAGELDQFLVAEHQHLPEDGHRLLGQFENAQAVESLAESFFGKDDHDEGVLEKIKRRSPPPLRDGGLRRLRWVWVQWPTSTRTWTEVVQVLETVRRRLGLPEPPRSQNDCADDQGDPQPCAHENPGDKRTEAEEQ